MDDCLRYEIERAGPQCELPLALVSLRVYAPLDSASLLLGSKRPSAVSSLIGVPPLHLSGEAHPLSSGP